MSEYGPWRRSSKCGTHGSCVEVTDLAPDGIPAPDIEVERLPDGSRIMRGRAYGTTETAEVTYTPEEWDAFVAGVMAGEFDRA